MNHKLRLITIFILFSFYAKGQNGMINLNLDHDYQLEKRIYLSSDSNFTAFKPLMRSGLQNLDGATADSGFRYSDLIRLNSENSDFSLSPILHYQYFQGEEETFQGFGAGASVRYSFKNKLSFGLDFAYYSVEYPVYQKEIIEAKLAVPSQNILSSKDGNISSNYISGYLNYAPSDIFDFQIGYGRNFIGDGYRSLLLSDHSQAYPYFRINSQVWRLKYTNLFSVQNNAFPDDSPFGKVAHSTEPRLKYTSTHFLDFKISSWLTIGLFESVIWQSQDTIFNRGFDVNYLNPVIFYRPIEFSTGSADNVMMGLNLKAEIAEKHIIYSQFIIDEFLVSEVRADIKQWLNPQKDIRSNWWANKYAFQLGWHSFDLFGWKGLEARLEFNFIRPYMYAHSSPDQSYSHANLPLGHPLGANFIENLAHLNYYFKRWRFHLKYHYSTGGKSFDTLNFGENILATIHTRAKDFEVRTGQGLSYKTHFADFGVSYMIQHEWDLYVQLGILSRRQKVFAKESENYLYLKLSTALFNQYFDY